MNRKNKFSQVLSLYTKKGWEKSTGRVVRAFSLLLLGMILLSYGILEGVFSTGVFKMRMSDEEIIKRAKELGLEEVKEKFLRSD